MNNGQDLYKLPAWQMDEGKILKCNPELKPYGYSEHQVGNKAHVMTNYKYYLGKNQTAALYWSYCGTCNQLRGKKVIWYTKDEDGYDTAYVREILKGGEFVD